MHIYCSNNRGILISKETVLLCWQVGEFLAVYQLEFVKLGIVHVHEHVLQN